MKPSSRITLTGRLNAATGKLESPPPEIFARLVRAFSLTLIEGDGAAGKPLKGWQPDEPVVPGYTTVTIGVLPVFPLGLPVSEALVHRLPLFCELAGVEEGAVLEARHLAAVIRKGLFARAQGRRILFFSRVHQSAAMENAREVAILAGITEGVQ
jgi:probable selenium-dependent hydroxylase accessory protein YqeC